MGRCMVPIVFVQMERRLQAFAWETNALRQRNVDLECALIDGASLSDRIDVTRLRRQVVELERQVAALDKDNKQLTVATVKMDVYRRCVEKEAAQLQMLTRYGVPSITHEQPRSCMPFRGYLNSYSGYALTCQHAKPRAAWRDETGVRCCAPSTAAVPAELHRHA